MLESLKRMVSLSLGLIHVQRQRWRYWLETQCCWWRYFACYASELEYFSYPVQNDWRSPRFLLLLWTNSEQRHWTIRGTCWTSDMAACVGFRISPLQVWASTILAMFSFDRILMQGMAITTSVRRWNRLRTCETPMFRSKACSILESGGRRFLTVWHPVMWNDIDLYHAYRDFTTDPNRFPADQVRTFIEELVSSFEPSY